MYLSLEIKDKLKIIENQGKMVSLFWIPAHKGIEFNELVDKAAKDSIVSGRDSQFEIPLSYLKKLLEEETPKRVSRVVCSNGRD